MKWELLFIDNGLTSLGNDLYETYIIGKNDGDFKSVVRVVLEKDGMDVLINEIEYMDEEAKRDKAVDEIIEETRLSLETYFFEEEFLSS